LPLLVRFVAVASTEELKVAEQIVSDRDEFTIYTNLSRRLEPRAGPLSEKGNLAPEAFAKKGIAWLMALARVELAAMAAGFSPDPEPFGKGRPSSYELDAYREMLDDGMRTHYWALARDGVPRTMRRGVTPDQQAIAYLRRTNLAIKFLDEARNERQARLTSSEQAELDTWQQHLKELQSHLLYGVLGVHDAVILSNSSKNLYLHKCGTTREQILADIRSGAKINGASADTIAAVRKDAGLPAATGPSVAPGTPPSKPAAPPPSVVTPPAAVTGKPGKR
jgi:hypothetical protein